MPELKTPIIPVSDQCRLENLPDRVFNAYEEMKSMGLEGPMVILEVCEPGRFQTNRLKVGSEHPERMVIQTFDREARDAIMAALARVQLREPDGAPRLRRVNFQFRPNQPLKYVFERMEAAPMTVFSVTLGAESPCTLFFLRTQFTIEELRRELLDDSAGAALGRN